MDKQFKPLPTNKERKYQSLKIKLSIENPVDKCFKLTIFNKENIL
jgi:hypothetical protein